jgi:predicted enzyme related to lactoylglutathione lyase
MTVTGIGGLFFRSRDPDALRKWYSDHLGVGGGEWGLWQQQAGMTVFSPFKADTDYFPSDRQWMINFRVDGLDDLLDRLRAAGAEVLTKPEWDDPTTGRFARIHDPEGNPIELWEPAQS